MLDVKLNFILRNFLLYWRSIWCDSHNKMDRDAYCKFKNKIISVFFKTTCEFPRAILDSDNPYLRALYCFTDGNLCTVAHYLNYIADAIKININNTIRIHQNGPHTPNYQHHRSNIH